MVQNRIKENAYGDYIAMIQNSWTYARLTQDERIQLFEAYDRCILFGSYRQRWDILENVYTGFLAGLGYYKEPVNWRSTEPETEP